MSDEQEKDHGGTSLTEVDSVSVLVHAPQLSHDEEWRIVPSVPTLSVSSWGRVKINPYEQSMPHGGVKRVVGVPRRGNRSHRGKRRNFIHQRQTYVVGKLVCEAFHGEPPSPYHQHVVRLDRDVENNRPENLRWGTYGETL